MPALSLLNNTFFNPHPEIITNVTNLKFKLTWIWYFFPTFIDPSIYTNIYIYAAAPINMYIDTYIICGWFYKPPSFPGGAVNLGEWHWNMYNIIYETTRQSRFDAWYWMLGAGALGPPRGMVMGREEGGRFRMGNTCIPVADSFRYMAKPIHTVKLKNKIKLKK